MGAKPPIKSTIKKRKEVPKLKKHGGRSSCSAHSAPLLFTIAYRIFRSVVVVANNVSIMGCSIVYLLLSAGLISELSSTLAGHRLPICYTVLVVTVIIIPLNWFGTPVDFWSVCLVYST